MTKKYDVTGIGVSTVDFINVVEKFSAAEDVQKTKMMKIDCGGPVATAIVSLARLGAHTAMIDNIGNDLPGQFILSEYIKAKVDTTYIRIMNDSTSSISSILVRESDGTRIIYYSPSDAPELTRNDIDLTIIDKSSYLHTNGRHIDAAIHAAEYARKKGVKVSFDGGANRYRQEIIPLMKLSDICIVTKQFAENFSTETNTEKAAGAILSCGPELVVITEGITGSWLFTRQINGYHQRAFIPDNIVDTTGCGDCYHGAFLFGLVHNWDLYKTIEFASAAAALNARGYGGRSALPTFTEVSDFISKNN